MKVLIAGDFCDSGAVYEAINNTGASIIDEEIRKSIELSDYSIVNFEFPVVVDEGHPIEKDGPSLCGHADSVKFIKQIGFNCATLANNHILDQGIKCAVDTKKIINQEGIDTVGFGNDIQDASRVLYKLINNQTLAIINCCENEFSIASTNTSGANPINPVRQFYQIREAKENADYVLVIIHGGHEHYQLPSPRMKELYHFFIEVGADVVVNHHQHCFSGFEKCKNGLIFYGLGNFLFDSACSYKTWNEGYMVEIDFSKEGFSFRLIPYTQSLNGISVRPLSSDDDLIFQERLFNLNEIINDNVRLEAEFEQWNINNSGWITHMFEPWQDKITSFLYYHGLLPSFIKGHRKQLLLNMVRCESHLDRVRYILSHKK